MPLTPRFTLSQTSSQISIVIQTPHVRVSASSIEAVVDGSDFHFFSAPYLLHLVFPGRLEDDPDTNREAKATFDPSKDNGTLTINIWKEEEGFWKDLDLLGRLKQSSKKRISPLIVDETSSIIEGADKTKNTDHDLNDESSEKPRLEDFTYLDQSIHSDIQSSLRPHYGFLNMYHSVFTDYAREGLSAEMIGLPVPDETPANERREMRLSTENDNFLPDRYVADIHIADICLEEDDGVYSEAIIMIPHWKRQPAVSVKEIMCDMQRLSTSNQTKTKENIPCQHAEVGEENFFSDVEFQKLASINTNIPDNKDISNDQLKSLLLSLMDILFAYAYDHRLTTGDPTCESSWTIVTLSPTLCWFECYLPTFDSICCVLQWSIRRSLIYPYIRNYNFAASQIVQDVFDIIIGGRRTILRCLLHIRDIMEKSEFHYLLNKLYIDPYIKFIQMIKEEEIDAFATDLKNALKDKGMIGKDYLMLHLTEIEMDASKSLSVSSEDNSSECSTNDSETDSASEISNSAKSIEKKDRIYSDESKDELKAPSTNASQKILDIKVVAGTVSQANNTLLDWEDLVTLKDTENSKSFLKNESSKKKTLIQEL